MLPLLIHYYPQLPVMLLFESGSHKINIGAAYELLGPEKSNVYLGFHTFTGCDQTSKCNAKSKDASEDMLAAFADLGARNDLVDTTLTSLEKYVVRLFCESGDLSSLTDARWLMYSKQQDCDNLPPTKAALKFKVSRSYLICLIWKSSHLQFPKYCDPTTLGWEKCRDVLMPILTDEPPAPEAVIEMSLCKGKTGCSTMRCKR